MSLATRAIEFLNTRLKSDDVFGETVSYERPGGSTITPTMWFGPPEGLAEERATMVKVESSDIDGHCEASDLTIGTPTRGDLITRTINSLPVVYEVRPRSAVEPEWRYSDAGRTMLRIQLKKKSG